MSTQRFTILIYGSTLLLSAVLMFAVQPMIGRMLLPKVGGAPAGWIVAVAFFQLCLLAGYFAAHLMSRQSPRRHAMTYAGLLALGVVFLPLHLGAIDMSRGAIPVVVLYALTASVAVPFIAISATSSTIQRLFSASGHARARDPYFLYTASNIGSFAGLLGYPLLAEPFFGVTQQAIFWMAGYALLIILALCCLLMASPEADVKPETVRQTTPRASNRTRAAWVFLSFIPSCLMMATTTRISTEIVSFPLLWVLPLAVYLLTFILAFSPKKRLSDNNATILFLLSFVFLFGALIKLPFVEMFGGSWWSAAVYIGGFGIIAYYCHRRLAALRPLENAARDLTEFYMLIAVGGALGGALNAFVFPFVFNGPHEYPLTLCFALLALPAGAAKIKKADLAAFSLGVLAMGVFTYIQQEKPAHFSDNELAYQWLALSGLLAFVFIEKRLLFASFIVIFFLSLSFYDGQVLTKQRNFFGSAKVLERSAKIGNKKVSMRRFMHGTTLHGLQVMDDEWRLKPTTYYDIDGPLGDMVRLVKPWDVLSIGLGVGTTSCVVPPDSTLTFIDIDRDVAKIAQKYFTYLSDCPRNTPVRVMFGDGRLVLDDLQGKTYDLLIVDAFTSDAIPMHLLTVEALEKMKAHLKTGGVIAFHISNRYFDLSKQLQRQAEAVDMKARIRKFIPFRNSFSTSSVWVALSPDPHRLEGLDFYDWDRIDSDPDRPVWTDDFNNLLSTLHILEK